MLALLSQYGPTASMVWLVAGVIVALLLLFLLWDALAAAVERLRNAGKKEPSFEPEPGFDRERRGGAPATSLGAKISPDTRRPWSRQSPLAARFYRRVFPERRTFSEHRPNEPFED